MAAPTLLARLEGVRETGPGRWIARCPAHDDRRPSMSIRELPDGRVLVHDHGGCDTGAVLDAMGLTLADLYPDARPHHARPSHSRLPAADVLALAAHEITVVRIVLADARRRGEITADDWSRIETAGQRLDRVMGEAGL